MSIRKLLLVIIAITGLAVALFWWLELQSQSTAPETEVIKFVDHPRATGLRTTVLLDNKIATCANGRCQLSAVSRSSSDSVTDGTWSYFYEETDVTRGDPSDRAKPAQGGAKVFLKRKNQKNSETEIIMESTPLTRPRGLYLSPDNTQVAFWLDNVADPTEQLTELWIFDAVRGGIRVVAEKLYVPDIRTQLRWNTSSKYLYFIADTGPRADSADHLEIIRLGTQPPSATAGFSQGPWSSYQDDWQSAVSDLSADGKSLAYVTTNVLGRSTLHIEQEKEPRTQSTIQGQVAYLQWLSSTSLLYVVADRRGFTFWLADSVHRFLARRPGKFLAARPSDTGEHIVFASTSEDDTVSINSLHPATGTVVLEGELSKSIDLVRIVSATQKSAEDVSSLPIIERDDAEIAAFIERNIADIADNPQARAAKIIFTDQTNTVFLEYIVNGPQAERVLLTIMDVIHDEWVIKGRYRIVDSSWQKVQGGALADPKPLRLYEWEQAITRWILKETID